MHLYHLYILGEGKLIFGDNFYEGHFTEDRMLGPGRYVFKDGSQQIGEYVLEKAEMNNNYESEEKSETNGRDTDYITKWKCKKRILGNPQHGIIAENI